MHPVPDEAGLRAVFGHVELVGRHAAKLSGEVLGEKSCQRFGEGLAPAHVVLEEARLRLVHARAGAALERGEAVGRVDALLVHGMPALVEHAEDIREHVVRVDVACDGHKAR